MPSGYSIVRYDRTEGKTYTSPNLKTVSFRSNPLREYAVYSYNTNGLQNGSPDGVALLDNLGLLIQFLSDEGTFIAVGGPAHGLMSKDIHVRESNSTSAAYSLQLHGSGAKYTYFYWAHPNQATLGAANTGQKFFPNSNSGKSEPGLTLFFLLLSLPCIGIVKLSTHRQVDRA